MASQQITPDTPALTPPPGIEPNFDNPPSLHSTTLCVGIVSMFIITVAICMRTYTKAVIMKSMRHEDYVAIFALIGILAYMTMYIYVSSIGITRNQWDVRLTDMPNLLYTSSVFQIIYGPTMLATKYFILVALRRIFCPHRVKHAVWWAVQLLIAITGTFYTSCFFTFVFQCVPREKIWNPSVKGVCINNIAAILAVGIINLIIDLGILVTPIWAIWQLHMPIKRKLGVASIFAIGFLTCGIAAAGLAYRVPLMTAANQTHAIAKAGLWTFAEFVGTVVAGCMPVIPRFYEAKIQPSLSRLSSSSSKGSQVQDRSEKIVITTKISVLESEPDHLQEFCTDGRYMK